MLGRVQSSNEILLAPRVRRFGTEVGTDGVGRLAVVVSIVKHVGGGDLGINRWAGRVQVVEVPTQRGRH